MKNKLEQQTGNEISTTRKHLYFYVLLALGTLFTHRMLHAGTSGAESKVVQQVAQMQESVRSFAALQK